MRGAGELDPNKTIAEKVFVSPIVFPVRICRLIRKATRG